MCKLNVFDWIMLIVVFIGGINWGMVGFFDFNLVKEVFGDMTMAARIVYAVVGVASLYLLLVLITKCSSKKEM